MKEKTKITLGNHTEYDGNMKGDLTETWLGKMNEGMLARGGHIKKHQRVSSA